jgi:hypothetical protein
LINENKNGPKELDENIKNECVYNCFTTFINSNKKYTQSFWDEIDEVHETDEKDDITSFLTQWLKHIETDTTLNKAKFLEEIVLNIKKDNVALCNEYLWSFPGFRKMIKSIDVNTYLSGKEMSSRGIFSSLFSHKNMSNTLRLKCTRSIISDRSLHEYLVSYIAHCLRLNMICTSSTYYNLNFLLKKCSDVTFNIFIFELLNAISKKHSDAIDNIIAKDKTYSIDKEKYTVNEGNLDVQLCVTLMLGVYVVLQTCYNEFKTHGKNGKIAIKFLSKEWIQDIMIDYFKVHKYIGLSSVAIDVVGFIEFVSDHKLKINIKNEMYELLSTILGGIGKTIEAPFRYNAYVVIEKIYHKTGFCVFKNFFTNLFRYICEVDTKKLDYNLSLQTNHHMSLVNTLQQMVDITSELDKETRYRFAETMFKLISRSLDLFDIFDDDLYKKAKSEGSLSVYKLIFNKSLQTVVSTLVIYKLTYEKKLIDIEYPETEEKFIALIGRTLKNLDLCDKQNIFKLNLNNTFHHQIINVCYDVVLDKVNKKSESLVEIKDIILKTLNLVKLDEENVTKIETFLTEIIEEDTVNIDESLLDPITFKKIKNPIMIPNCNEIFERSTIMSQIFQQGIHPYTREELNLEIIENFNKEDKVVQKINEFNSRNKK